MGKIQSTQNSVNKRKVETIWNPIIQVLKDEIWNEEAIIISKLNQAQCWCFMTKRINICKS